MATPQQPYAARLDIDYPERLDRFTTFVRWIWILPILVIVYSISAVVSWTEVTSAGEEISRSSGGIIGGLSFATMLMIVFRQKYPRWWFDFAQEFTRFQTRVVSYFALLTDQYPSTTDEQTVHLDLDYPDAQRDLNQFLPLIKWLLALPHYVVLAVLIPVALVVVVIAWFAILFTGRYPRGLFDFVVGVGRWGLRVEAYAFLLLTDEYPPFSFQ